MAGLQTAHNCTSHNTHHAALRHGAHCSQHTSGSPQPLARSILEGDRDARLSGGGRRSGAPVQDLRMGSAARLVNGAAQNNTPVVGEVQRLKVEN